MAGITYKEDITPNTYSLTINEEVKKNKDAWERIEILYEHDEKKITKQCKIYPNESTLTYNNRKGFYSRQFINPTTDLIAGPVNTIVSNGVKEEFNNPKGMLAQFSKNVTLGDEKISMTDYNNMFVLPYLDSYGTVVIVVDKPKEEVLSRLHERVKGMPYISMIMPKDLLDWQKTNGELDWITYKVKYQEPRNDSQSDSQIVDLVYEYNKTDLIVRESGKIRPDLSFAHNWGFVPVILQASILSKPKDTIGKSTFFETSNMILTYNDHLSKLNSDIFKSNNKIVHSEDSVTSRNSGTDATGNQRSKSSDNELTYYYAGDKAPEYIKMEIDIEDKLAMAMYYLEKAVENERDMKSVQKKGVSGKQVAESGTAKMLDRDPLESKLDSLARDGENVYRKVMNMVNKILNTKEEFLFEYNKSYNLTPLNVMYDNILKSEKTKLANISPTAQKQNYKNLAPLLTDDKDTIEIINQEIDDADIESLTELDIKLEEMEKENFEKKEKEVEKDDD